MNNMPLSELFGFLKHPDTIEFDGGSIDPTDSFQDGLKYIEKYENKDGYIYPPQVTSSTQTIDFETGQLGESQAVPNSTRPSPVISLPTSHILHIDNPLERGNIMSKDAGLLIHLLGFIFGTRLQFSDWRFDGKVPTKYKNYLSYSQGVQGHFISHVYNRWKTLNPEQRKYYINILYMHGKAKSCEWEWDEFLYQYMVFDAIYKLYVSLGNPESGGHPKRIKGLCEYFNIRYEPELITRICKIRNDLFHEALWCSGTPGLQKIQSDSHLIPKCLERLNSQLIVAIIGYRNNYSMSASWSDLYFRGEAFDKFT
ncbi:MAG: hypothetical protein ACXW03_12320 [Methylobacter sp.]